MDVSTAYTSTSLFFASHTFDKALSTSVTAPGALARKDRVSISEEALNASLSTEAASLSVDGTLSGKDGKEVGFSLDLQYDHLSFAAESAEIQVGHDGVSLSYAGAAADVSAKSYSFTMSSAGDDEPVDGKGSSSLNDDVSRIAKQAKPLVKEFMVAAGLNDGWGEVNRFLRTVA